MAKVIITCALTGAGNTPSMSPYLPITPQQLVDEAVRVYEAGGAIAHIHVRNPETGQPSADTELFREVATKVKSKCNIILCFTTGGSPEMTTTERARVVTALKPELATFNAGSLNFGMFP
ncbi:MAG: 3-keto-5-aminohexanoate cleavage protein, partial [candidate division WOR-3 bacterium]